MLNLDLNTLSLSSSSLPSPSPLQTFLSVTFGLYCEKTTKTVPRKFFRSAIRRMKLCWNYCCKGAKLVSIGIKRKTFTSSFIATPSCISHRCTYLLCPIIERTSSALRLSSLSQPLQVHHSLPETVLTYVSIFAHLTVPSVPKILQQ